MFSLIRQRRDRGFTLTELSIVLGIIGLVLSGIWVAVGRTSDSQKINKTITQLISISSSIRSLYAAKPFFASATQASITCDLINMNVFPSDTLPTTTCVPGNYATYPSAAWGGSHFSVFSSSSSPAAGISTFEIQITPIPIDALKTLVAKLALIAPSAGITYIYDGNSTGWLEVSTIDPATIPTPSSDGNFSTSWKLAQ